MAVRILIRRRIRQAEIQSVSQMLVKARTNAIGQPGYISSETLRGCDNPNEVLVISTWRTKADWDRYQNDPSRVSLEREFEKIFDGPAEYLAYEMGLSH